MTKRVPSDLLSKLKLIIYDQGKVELRQAHYRFLIASWPVTVGMLIAGAMIGDVAGLGIVIGFLGLTWLLFLFQRWLVRLPHADYVVEESVRNQSQRLGQTPPAVYEFRSAAANAAAMTGPFGSACMVVNSGIYNLPNDELDAVLAHELVHIRHRDSFVTMALVTGIGVIGTAVAVSLVGKWAVALVGLLPLVSWLLEFKADVLAARACGDPLPMGRALQHLKPYNWIWALFLLFCAVVALLSHPLLSLLQLLLFSYALASILPTHPPTFMRRLVLKKVKASSS